MFVERYQGQVYNLAFRMLGTATDAEDISEMAETEINRPGLIEEVST